MDNEWNNNEYLPPQPEHSIDPEFTPEYPDVTFFKESAVTMREENIFQGEVPQGEKPRKAQEAQKAKRSRMSWFRKFLGSAMRGGAAIVAATTLIANAAAGDQSAGGNRIRGIFRTLDADAFVQPSDYTPEELNAVWRSDPEGPHQYDFSNLIVLKEASCTENGLSCYVCADCGVRLTQVTTKAHEPGAPVPENVVEPDCVHDGSREDVTYCAVCGKELSRTKTVLGALGHTGADPVIENVIDPDCVEDGSEEEVVYCSVCGEEVSRTTVVLEALGHTEGEPVMENEVEPGCEEEGSAEEVVYCSVCGEELSRTVIVLEALGHTEDEPVTENESAASCTAEGSRDEVIYCSRCGEELSRTTETTPALGHSYTAKVTAATCTAQGYTTHTCSRCGNSYQDTYTAALGHSYTNKVTAATCTAQGYTTHTCSRCGNSYRDTYTAALGHDFELVFGVGDISSTLQCSHGCGTYGLTITVSSANTLTYTIHEALWAKASGMDLNWGDLWGYTDPNDTWGTSIWVKDGYKNATSRTGTILLDCEPVSGQTYYYKLALRIEGGGDMICRVYPQGGESRTYTQP